MHSHPAVKRDFNRKKKKKVVERYRSTTCSTYELQRLQLAEQQNFNSNYHDLVWKITCEINPNGVLWVFSTPPLPQQALHDCMQLLDLAPVPPQLSHVSKQETSIPRCPPKIDSSKLKCRSYLQYKRRPQKKNSKLKEHKLYTQKDNNTLLNAGRNTLPESCDCRTPTF